MDTKHSGVITFDAWLEFCLRHIAGKVVNIKAHPILDAEIGDGSKDEFLAFVKMAIVPGTKEYTEMYWYLLEMFMEHDKNKVTFYMFILIAYCMASL